MSGAPLLPRWFVIALALFLAGVGAAAWWLFVPPSRVSLDRELAVLRDAGFALRPSDFAGEVLPDDRNGAAEFEAAWDWVLADRGGTDRWKAPGPWSVSDKTRPWRDVASAEDVAAVAKWLEGLEPFFTHLDAALARPALRWYAPLSGPGGADRWWAGRLFGVRELLIASAAASPTPEERLASAVRLLRTGERLGPGSVLLTMTATEYEASGREAFRRLVHEGELPAATLRAALEGERIADRLSQVGTAVRAEIATIAWEADPESGAGPNERAQARMDPPPTPDQLADVLKTLRLFAEVEPRSFQDAIVRFEAIRSLPEARPEFGGWKEHLIPWCCEADTSHRLLRIALAALERRERDGAWPASLDALEPDFGEGKIPIDAWDGAPLRYAVKDGVATFASRDAWEAQGDAREPWKTMGLRIEIRR